MKGKIIKEDNHQDDIVIILDRIKHLKKKGVLHIGAHIGEEVAFYRENNFQNVCLIEAHPELFSNLVAKFGNDQDVKLLNYAICDQNGFIDFHVHQSNSGIESSSIHSMDTFDKIVPSLKTTETLKVKSKTIDSLFDENLIKIEDYNILVSDIQGADYLGLIGAKNSISQFDAVIVEVQCVKLYDNYVSEKQMDELLKNYGFIRDFSIYHNLYKGDHHFPAWGEVVYIKENA